MNLRRTAAGLRSLLNLPTQETRRMAAFHATLETRGTDVESSSTDRVIQILSEKADVTTRAEIAHEFERRGWDAEWKEPEAALRMAIRRASERDGVVAVGPGSFAYMPAMDDAARGALQRRLSERRMRREAQIRSSQMNETRVPLSQNAGITVRPDGDRGEGTRRE